MSMGFFVKIGADASEAIEALGRVRDRTTDLERGINKLQKNLGGFGTAATKGLTVPIVATTTAMALSTKEAMKFNKGMTEVSTLLKNVSQKDFEMMKKQTLAFSTQMGIASSEVVPALYQAISAGIPKENVFAFLEAAGKASIGGVTNLETSVDGLTSVINAYGQDVLSVEKASDLMFTTVRLGKTNFEELSGSLYNVIPIASNLGVSFEDVSAALATITIQGTPTAQATTQLRAALVELSKEGSKTDLVFKNLTGKSFRDFINSGGDLETALKLLETEANKSGKSISSYFSSVEASNAVMQLTGKSATSFSNALNEMTTSANATNIAFDKMDIDESREFEKLKVEIHNLVIELGQNLIPIVRDDLLPLFRDTLMPIANDLIVAIGKVATVFNSLPAPLKTASFAFVGMVAAIGPAALALSTMVGGVTNAKIAIGGMKTVFTTLIPVVKNSTVAIKGSAVAWKALNLVIAATPVGLILAFTAAIVACTVSIYQKEKADKEAREAALKNAIATLKQKEAFNALVGETDKLVSRYTELAEKTKLTREEQAELETITTRLKDLYPDLNIVIDENGKAMITNIGITYDDIAAKKELLTTTNDLSEAELRRQVGLQKTKVLEAEALLDKSKNPPKRNILIPAAFDPNFELIPSVDSSQLIVDEQTKILDKLEADLAKLEGVKIASPTTNGKDPKTESLEKQIELLKKQIGLKKENNNANGGGGSNSKPDKVFADYVKELEKELFINDRKVEQLKEINGEYDDSKALQERNSIITSAITQMASELSLTEKQALQLGETYGSAFETGDTVSDFEKMKSSIYENISAYEEEIKVRRELGEVIEEADVAIGKDDIAKQGILQIVNSLELTEEQVKSLKNEFGDLFKSVEEESQTLAEYMKENWATVSNEMINFASEATGIATSIFQNQVQQQIDALEGRKTKALEAIDEELTEYLKANKAMEKSEADRLKDSIKDIQKRQKIALGLYEQERLQKELKEKQADLIRVAAEESATIKKLDIEKNYNNEIMRLKHKQDMANWAAQLAQATASAAQAIINAVASAMSTGAGALVMTPLLTGMAAALTTAQIAVVASAKPQEPTYLASGGLIRRRTGGLNAIIGEGNSNEAVIPLRDDVLAGIGNAMAHATNNNEVISNKNVSSDTESETEYQQPIMFNIDGKTVGNIILSLTKRGVKVVHQRGIIG